MTEFYWITEEIRNEFNSYPLVNTTSYGDLANIDIAKQTIFPLVHVNVLSATPRTNTTDIDLLVLVMDIVDFSKDPVTDIYLGNDNEHDVLNNTYQTCLRFHASLLHGDLYDKMIQLNSFSMESFTERFENYLAGWAITLTVTIPNNMSIC
jgi:hypothetical protein